MGDRDRSTTTSSDFSVPGLFRLIKEQDEEKGDFLAASKNKI